ncbi:MAG: T9SS type A sorting domain-containing protein, partial [Bacteroidetes bacterium]|nr:T9SS type A sorting domain-containing protein [Bacteroidota bacterium]
SFENPLKANTTYKWRLRAVNVADSLDGQPKMSEWSEMWMFQTGLRTSNEQDGHHSMPGAFSLRQNYPNPFNPVTQIEFEVPATAEIRLEVFDVLGRQVRVLADGLYGAGAHSVSFDASDLPSGLYMYRLTSADYVQTRSMQLVK